MATTAAKKPVASTVNVGYVLPEVLDMVDEWRTVRDCVGGQSAVKERGVTYLPMPNAADQSTENVLRYDAYKNRGIFVNMTGRTLNGMVGTAFNKAPIATLPPELDIMHENVDGGATTMDQQARQVLSDALGVGRCGLLTDYPTADGFVSRAQVNNGEMRPVIQFYFAEDIINWRYETVNAIRKLSLVVLVESYEVEIDEFKRTTEMQWRVLRLVNGIYTVEVYRKTEMGIVSQGVPMVPLQSGAKPFDYIPFEFVGSRNNDGGIDEVPLSALADVNLGHYRNSCDFEEMVFILGQPTTVIAGLNKSWVEEVLKGEVKTGSSTALMLPVGASATYLQVNESQLALKAMEHKELMAAAIGAKLVNPNSVQRTAKEATMDDASEQSVLLSAVYNVNSAYRKSLESAALFAGAEITDDLGYEINTDFEIMSLDAAALQARVKMWTDGAITFSEMRSILVRAGIATLDDAQAKAELEKEALANAAAMGLGPEADTNPDGTPKTNGATPPSDNATPPIQ